MNEVLTMRLFKTLISALQHAKTKIIFLINYYEGKASKMHVINSYCWYLNRKKAECLIKLLYI